MPGQPALQDAGGLPGCRSVATPHYAPRITRSSEGIGNLRPGWGDSMQPPRSGVGWGAGSRQRAGTGPNSGPRGPPVALLGLTEMEHELPGSRQHPSSAPSAPQGAALGRPEHPRELEGARGRLPLQCITRRFPGHFGDRDRRAGWRTETGQVGLDPSSQDPGEPWMVQGLLKVQALGRPTQLRAGGLTTPDWDKDPHMCQQGHRLHVRGPNTCSAPLGF